MLNMKTLKTHPMVFDYMSNWSLREMSLIANSIYELSLLVLRKSLSISIEKQADTGGILCIYLATHLKSNLPLVFPASHRIRIEELDAHAKDNGGQSQCDEEKDLIWSASSLMDL